MNNQDVANQLGITRQGVQASLKRSTSKLYKKFKNRFKTTPYETFACLITGLEIEYQSDINTFFNYLSKEDQNEIKSEAENFFPNLRE